MAYSPRTVQEMRAGKAAPEFVRGKRTARMLPSSWDGDMGKARPETRSWKLYRKKQWDRAA